MESQHCGRSWPKGLGKTVQPVRVQRSVCQRNLKHSWGEGGVGPLGNCGSETIVTGVWWWEKRRQE